MSYNFKFSNVLNEEIRSISQKFEEYKDQKEIEIENLGLRWSSKAGRYRHARNVLQEQLYATQEELERYKTGQINYDNRADESNINDLESLRTEVVEYSLKIKELEDFVESREKFWELQTKIYREDLQKATERENEARRLLTEVSSIATANDIKETNNNCVVCCTTDNSTETLAEAIVPQIIPPCYEIKLSLQSNSYDCRLQVCVSD